MPPALLVVDTDLEQRTAYAAGLAAVASPVYTAATFPDAKSLLTETRPDVLVTQVRLADHNGMQLALWGQSQLPHLRSVIIGQSDPALEPEANACGFFFVRYSDEQAVVEATLEAIAREAPRRRWRRKVLASELFAEIDGHPAQILDVSYGGFRAEKPEAFRAVPNADLAVHIRELDLRTEARCRWVASRTPPGVCWCGASLEDAQVAAGSRWRALVDDVERQHRGEEI